MEIQQHQLGSGVTLVRPDAVADGLDLTIRSEGPFRGWIALKCMSPLRIECPDRVRAWIETIHHRFGYGVIEVAVDSGEAVREARVRLRGIPPPASPSPQTPADFEQFRRDFTARSSRFPGRSVEEFLDWQRRYRAKVRECLWGEDWRPPEPCVDAVRQVVSEKPEYVVERLTYRSFTGREATALFATPRASRGSPAPLVVAIHGHETRWGEAVLEAFEPGHAEISAIISRVRAGRSCSRPPWTIRSKTANGP